MDLKSLVIPLLLNNDPFKKGLDESESLAGSKSNSILDKLGGFAHGGALAFAAVGTAAVAAGGAIVGAFGKAVEASGNIVDAAAKAGVTVQKYQELAYVGNQVGVSVDTITNAFSKTSKAMGDVVVGNESMTATFDTLGLSIYNSQGQLKDSSTVMLDAMQALGKVENATQRDILANDLFGKSFAELKPMMTLSSTDFANLVTEASKVGAVIGTDSVNAMESFGDKIQSLKDGAKGLASTLLSGLTPAFDGLATKAQGYLGTFQTLVASSNEDIGKIVSGTGTILGQIIGDIATEGPKLLNSGLELIKGLATSLTSQFHIIIPAIIEMVTSIADFIIKNLDLIINAGLELILGLIKGISTSLPQLITKIAEILPVVVTTLIENIPLLLDCAISLIKGLAQGLISAIPVLIEAVPNLVKSIAQTLIDSVGLLIDAGKDLVTGILDGIKSNWTWLTDSVSGLFGGLVDSIKNLLGISNPSKVFKGIGKNMALGLGTGFAGAFSGISSNMNSLISEFGNSVNPTFSKTVNISSARDDSNQTLSELLKENKEINKKTKALDENYLTALFMDSLVKGGVITV